MGNQTHIEINGKRYDARTGKLLSDHQTTVQKSTAQVSQAVPVKHPSDISRVTTVSKQVHSNTQRSQTLMRHSVKKPAKLTMANPVSGKTMADVARPSSSIQAQRPLASRPVIDPAREARSKEVKRSHLVSKYSGLTSKSNMTHHADRSVPTRMATMTVAKAPAHVEPQIAHNTHKTHHIIEQGLRNAQGHTQPVSQAIKSPRSRGRKLTSLAAGGLAVFLLGAFFIYQNIPNISMRYAAQRAGISAQLPAYQPSGFALQSKIKYTAGQIEMSFRSNTDDRQFTITQRESNWNSDTLMSNYVSSADNKVQTYQDKGRTIYLYGDSNATWVNGGVWYDIHGNSQLNSDQLIRIASSM